MKCLYNNNCYLLIPSASILHLKHSCYENEMSNKIMLLESLNFWTESDFQNFILIQRFINILKYVLHVLMT